MKQHGCFNRTSLRETSRSVGIQSVEPQSMRRQSIPHPTQPSVPLNFCHHDPGLNHFKDLFEKCIFNCVCIHVCASICTHLRQAPTQSRQGSWIPWNWSHKRLWIILHRCWEPSLSPPKGSTFSQQLSPISSPSKDPFPRSATPAGHQFLVSCGRPHADPTRKDTLRTYSPKGQGAHSCGTTFDQQVESGFGDSFSSPTGSRTRPLDWLTGKYSSVHSAWSCPTVRRITLVLGPQSKPLDEGL